MRGVSSRAVPHRPWAFVTHWSTSCSVLVCRVCVMFEGVGRRCAMYVACAREREYVQAVCYGVFLTRAAAAGSGVPVVCSISWLAVALARVAVSCWFWRCRVLKIVTTQSRTHTALLTPRPRCPVFREELSRTHRSERIHIPARMCNLQAHRTHRS